MKIPPSLPSRAGRGGFTLIELLTVVAIIAVLVAGSVGAYGKIVESVRKKDAEAMAQTITSAVEQFYTEYSRLPRPESGSGQAADIEAETSHSDGLITVLIGKEGQSDDKQNTRDFDFLEGLKQAKANPRKSTNPETGTVSEWINGLVVEEGQHEVVDPWGNYFKIKLDLNYDGEIENPDTDEGSGSKSRTVLRKRVLLWSAGKDNDEDTWNDNVKSW